MKSPSRVCVSKNRTALLPRFFETDLTYADLGYVERHGTYRLLGEETHNGIQSYKVELVPAQQVYYSRVENNE